MNEQYSSALLERAVDEFSKLPGVGRKTAMRLVLLILLAFLLKKPLIENPLVRMFSEQLLNVPTVTEQMLGSKGQKDEQIRKLAESLVRELDDYDEEGGEE